MFYLVVFISIALASRIALGAKQLSKGGRIVEARDRQMNTPSD